MGRHGQYRIEGDNQSIVLDVTPDVRLRVARLWPAANKRTRSAIRVPVRHDTVLDVHMFVTRYDITPHSDADQARFDALVDAAHSHDEKILNVLSGTSRWDSTLGEPARPPRPYQTAAAQLAVTTGSLLVADDLGLGKTYTSLLALAAADALPALVVAPPHLAAQWGDTELPAIWPTLNAHVTKSSTPYELPAGTDVIITTYTKLDRWRDHLAGLVRTVIFDEVHDLRAGTDTKKGAAAAHIAASANTVIGLSATPVWNRGSEIYAIMRILRPTLLGSWAEFSASWVGYDGNVKDPRAFGAYLVDTGAMVRRRRTDVGVAADLPPVANVPIYLPGGIERDESAARLAQRFLTGGADAWAAEGQFDLRLRQLTGVAKAGEVANLVEMLLGEQPDRKLVLFGWHRDVYDVWTERLAAHNPVLYTGTESPAAKNKSFRAFVDDPECRVFIMSLRSGQGLDGLNDVCDVAVFGELDWSPAVIDQCVGRLHRPGQKGRVTAFFPMLSEGSDPPMTDLLGMKQAQADGIAGDPVRPSTDPAKRREMLAAIAKSYLSAA